MRASASSVQSLLFLTQCGGSLGGDSVSGKHRRPTLAAMLRKSPSGTLSSKSANGALRRKPNSDGSSGCVSISTASTRDLATSSRSRLRFRIGAIEKKESVDT